MAASRRSLLLLASLALVGGAGACKSDPHRGADGLERAKPSALAERAREAGIGEAGLVLTSFAPDDFPETLRRYPGARVTLGGKQPTATGKRSWTLTVETGDTKDQVRAFYSDNLPGFRATTDIDLGESALSVWRSDALDLEVVVGKGADGKTTVTLDAAER